MPDQTIPEPPILPDVTDVSPASPVNEKRAQQASLVKNFFHSKKKKRVFAAVLGIFFLIGTLVVGVTLTGEKQLLEQKAYVSCLPETSPCQSSADCCPDLRCDPQTHICQCGLVGEQICTFVPLATPGPGGCFQADCQPGFCCIPKSCFPSYVGVCQKLQESPSPTPTRTPFRKPTPSPTPTRTPFRKPTPTPTSCPAATPICYFDNCRGDSFCGGTNNHYKCCNAVAEWGYPHIQGCDCPQGSRPIGSVCLTNDPCTWNSSNAPAGIWCDYNPSPSCP